jgi:hypothetical protein
MKTQLLTTGAMCAVLTASLAADVKITSKTAGKMMGRSIGGDSIQYFKGTKMRTDSVVGGDQTSNIYDVDAQQIIMINHKRKEAEIFPMSEIAANIQKVTDADVKVSLTPTPRAKEMLGTSCTEYDLNIAIAFSPVPDQPITIVMSGPAWISKDVPGQADVATFYRAAAEKGFIFGDPRAAKAQPGQAKGMAAMYRAMADAGMPCGSEIEMKFEGQGMMAGMMNRMAGMTMSNTVTAVSTDALPDDTFTVPAGYKTKR